MKNVLIGNPQECKLVEVFDIKANIDGAILYYMISEGGKLVNKKIPVAGIASRQLWNLVLNPPPSKESPFLDLRSLKSEGNDYTPDPKKIEEYLAYLSTSPPTLTRFHKPLIVDVGGQEPGTERNHYGISALVVMPNSEGGRVFDAKGKRFPDIVITCASQPEKPIVVRGMTFDQFLMAELLNATNTGLNEPLDLKPGELFRDLVKACWRVLQQLRHPGAAGGTYAIIRAAGAHTTETPSPTLPSSTEVDPRPEEPPAPP
jgi:hypothetical protein